MESCREVPEGYNDPRTIEREREISSLALRYRSGDQAALGELYGRLEQAVHAFLRRHLSPPRSLPPGMEAEDLYQQAYVALAETALDWQPDRRDNFLPYFLRSFPWRIHRYLRSQTPSRRTSRFQMLSVPHDILMERVADVAGTDGRDWDDALMCAELLRSLPRPYYRAVRLHLFRGLPFAEVGEAMGISRSAAHEAFGRAISLMGAALAEPATPESPAFARLQAREEVDPASLRRCVEVLYRLAPSGSHLPGRKAVCREAGLTRGQYRQTMARLRASGCIVGRRPGTPGSLAYSTVPDALRRLGFECEVRGA